MLPQVRREHIWPYQKSHSFSSDHFYSIQSTSKAVDSWFTTLLHLCTKLLFHLNCFQHCFLLNFCKRMSCLFATKLPFQSFSEMAKATIVIPASNLAISELCLNLVCMNLFGKYLFPLKILTLHCKHFLFPHPLKLHFHCDITTFIGDVPQTPSKVMKGSIAAVVAFIFFLAA